jgi:hypothetical protein
MKLKLGMPPPEDLKLVNATRLNKDYNKLHVVALVFGIVVVTPLLAWAWVSQWGWKALTDIGDLESWQFLLTLAGVMAAHEVIHMLGHPRMGLSSLSYLGFLPKQGLFYASYLGVVTRRRFLVMALLPFFLLTVVPYCLAPYMSPTWRAVMTAVSVLNGMAASGDLWIVLQVLRRIPRGAFVQGEWYGSIPPVA